jgi:hypothetical protein
VARTECSRASNGLPIEADPLLKRRPCVIGLGPGHRVAIEHADPDLTWADAFALQKHGRGHAYYGNLGGIQGATLDHDDINGFGPEIFTFPAPRPGKYRVYLHYYSDHGNGPTNASVSISVGSESKFQGSFGIESGAQVDVYTIEISDDLTITNIQSYKTAEDVYPLRCSSYPDCKELPFTSQSGENTFQVSTNLSSLEDGEIEYTVLNNTNGQSKVINSKELSNVLLDFTHTNLFTAESKPIVLTVTAKIVGGSRDGETAPAKTIVQDVKDQIRQEYLDLHESFPAAKTKVPVPTREQILNNAQWISKLVAETQYFSASEVFAAGSSPYIRQYAYLMADKSFAMLNTAREEYGSALNLNGTWRNPKHNAGQSLSASSSKHQTGDGCDIVPIRGSLSYLNWSAAIQDACAKALAGLGSGYQMEIHGQGSGLHCHLEYDP